MILLLIAYGCSVMLCFCSCASLAYDLRAETEKRYSRDEWEIIKRSYSSPHFLTVLYVIAICLFPLFNLVIGVYAVTYREEFIRKSIEKYDDKLRKEGGENAKTNV